MSSTREGARGIGEPYCNGIVRRMVSLPRSIVGRFSRVMGRVNEHPPLNFQLQYPQHPLIVPEERDFLASFERQYGTNHPFFYACEFMDTLKIAQDEKKFMFMYLHSPDHPFTPSFCRETLCSDLVVQFLDANFVSWGALADRGEGLQMAVTLRPASFPCCAVVAPAAGNSIAVLQQMEGPISPAELVGILQRTVEEQGVAFGLGGAKTRKEDNTRGISAKEEEKMRAERRLREEQDAAYFAALQIDKEKEERRQHLSSEKAQKTKIWQLTSPKQVGRAKQPSTIRATQYPTANRAKDPQATQILIRFPNGERREGSFSCMDKIQAIYRYIDSLGLPGIGNYRLISSFPRKVYCVDQMGMTLKDAGLHPRATLFLELL